MPQGLSEWLERIGQEWFIQGAHPDGTIIQRSNDEQLARLIWERALGQQIKTEHEDGSISVDVLKPDPRAQQFIFERREGKMTQPVEDRGITALDRVDEAIAGEMNKAAEAIVDDNDSSESGDEDQEVQQV